MTEMQPSLFPEQNGDQADAQVIPFDQAAAAAHIAENAAPVEYPDRTSEAARDQGWGPVEVSETDNVRSIHTVDDSDASSAIERDSTRSRHPSAGRLRELPRQGANNQPYVKFDPDPEHVETYHMNKHEIAELRAKLRAKGE